MCMHLVIMNNGCFLHDYICVNFMNIKKNWFKTRATIWKNVIDNHIQCYKCNAHKLYDDTHNYSVKKHTQKTNKKLFNRDIFFMKYDLKSMLTCMSSFEIITYFN
jgi:hypothetical protein